ncbi:MAG: phosphatase PAP2 family protein [Bacteroidetes bacterium]|nr:phosphatase PAP2 family protein [Bacteroidota bacterium]
MSFLNNNKLIWSTALVILAMGVIFFSSKKMHRPSDPSLAIMLDWHDYAMKAERECEGYRMPIVARIYAYSGIAAWEAARPLLEKNLSQNLPTHFSGLKLPTPPPAESLHLPTVLNACYSTIFQKFFLVAPRPLETERMNLGVKWAKKLSGETGSEVFNTSRDFGEKIALAVYDWSSTDTIGHMAYLHIYDDKFQPPQNNAAWQPSDDFPMPPLLPRWNETRCFAINPNDFIATPPPPFSVEPQSPYYSQALEIYTMNAPLSADNQWIAEFWSDDFSGLTLTSAGRWISITNQVIQQSQPSPAKALETYLRVGITLSDATVACWNSKYKYNTMRPETFIRRIIQRDWRPIVHTPSHPSYPSAHAMVAAAIAQVLTQLYGDHYEITDRTHQNRTEFKGDPRHYHSFREMALESASSRIALGVHYRMDCDEGTRLGFAIGEKIASEAVKDVE